MREGEAVLQPAPRAHEVPLVVAPDEEEVQRRLQDGGRRQLADALERGEPVDEFLRARDPADAHARKERLGDRAEVDRRAPARTPRAAAEALPRRGGPRRTRPRREGRPPPPRAVRSRPGATAKTRRPVGFWKSGIV